MHRRGKFCIYFLRYDRHRRLCLQLRETLAGEETEQAARQRARLDWRAAEEEELMMRVPLAKKQLKGMRAAQRAGLSGGALLDDFADDVADLVKVWN